MMAGGWRHAAYAVVAKVRAHPSAAASALQTLWPLIPVPLTSVAHDTYAGHDLPDTSALTGGALAACLPATRTQSRAHLPASGLVV